MSDNLVDGKSQTTARMSARTSAHFNNEKLEFTSVHCTLLEWMHCQDPLKRAEDHEEWLTTVWHRNVAPDHFPILIIIKFSAEIKKKNRDCKN